MSVDTTVLIIGAGPSGIGTAAQIIRNFKTYDFEIIEKSNDVGGTWWLNTYPGCGCDVASHFYSYSFALNPNWSKVFALQPEIHAYFRHVAEQYKIPQRVRFNSEVTSAIWEAESATWLVEIVDLKTKETRQRRCKILVSAVGALSIPQECDIPGAKSFQGKLFHSATWDHSFDWKGRNVITIGNGCSASQFVPVMSSGEGAVARLTQFSRQPHWLAKRENPDYSSLFKSTMRWVPGAMRLYRWWIYWNKEMLFRGFRIKGGQSIRESWARDAAQYIRATAPERYREALVPKSVIGCKRRVNDTGYLACLHQPNVELVYDDPIQRITEEGVQTKSGRYISADAIILATGFQTHKFLSPMEIRGENGVTLQDHWDTHSSGSASAYFGTCISGFPNFFTMMGPNTVTGHLSVIYTVECQINFTMRVIRPIMKSVAASSGSGSNITRTSHPDYVAVTTEAEIADKNWLQEKCKDLVWATGCTSWFIDPKTGINTQMYPDWQFLFWARSYWITWKDLTYKSSAQGLQSRNTNEGHSLLLVGLLASFAVAVYTALL